MKLFRCQVCDNIVYFENRTCGRCGHRLAYVPELEIMAALEPAGGDAWTPLEGDGGPRFFCANAELRRLQLDDRRGRATSGSALACRHNDTIPDISDPTHLAAWREHRTRQASAVLQPAALEPAAEDAGRGPAATDSIFEFLADPPQACRPQGDDRPRRRGSSRSHSPRPTAPSASGAGREMAEPYRSLLGHFRHEVGHHYWDILVRDGGRLEQCRAVFGDDRRTTKRRSSAIIAQGAPADWPERFVSAYATCSSVGGFRRDLGPLPPYRRYAETASAFGLRIKPAIDKDGAHTARLDFDPYAVGSIEEIVDAWTPFVVAMNSVNRAMGGPGPLPVRSRAGGGREAALHPRAGAGRFGVRRRRRAGGAPYGAGGRRGCGDLTKGSAKPPRPRRDEAIGVVIGVPTCRAPCR